MIESELEEARELLREVLPHLGTVETIARIEDNVFRTDETGDALDEVRGVTAKVRMFLDRAEG